MKKLIEKLDPKYLKVCVYAAATVIITFGIMALLVSTRGLWIKLWSIFTAVLKPIIIGAVISYLFMPIVNKIEGLINKNKEHRWARSVGVFLTFIIVVAAISLIIGIIVSTVYKNITMLDLETMKGFYNSIQTQYTNLYGYFTDQLDGSKLPAKEISSFIAKITGTTKSVISGLLFGSIFSIYFMIDGKRISEYWRRALRIIFSKRSEEELDQFLQDADNSFSGYIRGQFVDAMIIGFMSTIALILAGVPNALLIGLLVGVGNLIPYFGPIIGYGTLIVVCIPSGAYDKMLIGAIVLTVAMFIDGNVINPRLLANTVKVHPLLVVAALLGGGAIGGIAGMLVAVPVAALIKVRFDRYLESMEKEG